MFKSVVDGTTPDGETRRAYVSVNSDRVFQYHPVIHSARHSPVVAPDLRYLGVPKSGVQPCSRYARLTRRRWSAASRVKRDSSLYTIRCQSDNNHDYCDTTLDNSTDFAESKAAGLKGRCERNSASAKLREMVEGTTGCSEKTVRVVR
ncbi:hypothetical protein TNCV_4893751 [Trichonephila clavipes]|nr:hypothetical protein TNCV_4893751 [Trichonephila clavipes]